MKVELVVREWCSRSCVTGGESKGRERGNLRVMTGCDGSITRSANNTKRRDRKRDRIYKILLTLLQKKCKHRIVDCTPDRVKIQELFTT